MPIPATAFLPPDISLLTDLYQLTMAYGYWKNGRAEDEAIFYGYYRKEPFGNPYTLIAGLETAIAYLQQYSFSNTALDYLASLTDSQGTPLFEAAFLDFLGQQELQCTFYALEEGSIAFAQTPIFRIQGPLWQAQLLETALLNCFNFQSLIASKAARIVAAAGRDPVLEFGLRRAQGMDGGLSASRAAYIGGCTGTSNVLAGKAFGIPVKGTHAHSWVMSFDTEMAAFEAYANAMPNNCILLLDTYQTEQGIHIAIELGHQLRKKGYHLQGVRLDSGDLVQLSRQARQALDAAGFQQTNIIASDGLDEYKIRDLKEAGAAIDAWGVGTSLVTAADQPSLGMVYKLAAVRSANGVWQSKMKLSNTPQKASTPGCLQTRRYFISNGQPFGDMIWDEHLGNPKAAFRSLDGRDIVATARDYQDLLQLIFDRGQQVYESPSCSAIQATATTNKQLFSAVDFDFYPVGLEQQLQQQKVRCLQQWL